MISFLVSFLLLVFTSERISACFSENHIEKFWIFIASAALQLGTLATVLSLFRVLNVSAWLLLQLVFLFFSGYFCKYKQIPFSFSTASVGQLDLQNSSLTVKSLFMLVVCVVLLSGIIRFLTPICDFDAKMYHASRVMYWLQNESIFPFVTHNDRQIVFPFGGELTFLWPMLFLKNDILAKMVFWLGYPLSACGLYALLREVNNKTVICLVGVLVFLTTPIILNSSIWLKPVMWLTFYALGAVFWVVRSCKNREKTSKYIFLSALFIALSVNVKTTAIVLLPPLVIVTFLMRSQGSKTRNLFHLVKGFFYGLVLSGLAVTLWFNCSNFGHPLAPKSMQKVHCADTSLLQLYTHAVRFPIILTELPYVPSSKLRSRMESFGARIISFLGAGKPLKMEERDWPGTFKYKVTKYARRYSLAGLFWLPFMCIVACQIYIKRRSCSPVNDPLFVLLLFQFFFMAGVIFTLRWTCDSLTPCRFLVVPYALFIPIIATVVGSKIKRNYIKWVVVLLIVFTVSVPLATKIQHLQFALACPSTKRECSKPFTEALNFLPDRARILFVGSHDSFDYLLFAGRKEGFHYVISWGKEQFSKARMQTIIQENEITHILITNDQLVKFGWGGAELKTTEMVQWLSEQDSLLEVPLFAGRIRLFEVLKYGCSSDVGCHLQTFKSPVALPVVVIGKHIRNHVGVDPFLLQIPWPVEKIGSSVDGFLWLGCEQGEGVIFVLWSDKQRDVVLRLNLTAGPSREDSIRTVQVERMQNGEDDHPYPIQIIFDGYVISNSTVDLLPGRNLICVKALDEKTLLKLPNGDTRQLIVGLAPY